MDAALDLPLDPSSKLVLVVLADHANNDGEGIYPGNERIARRASLSKRQTQRVLAHLESHGIIRREKWAQGGHGHAVEWSINATLLAVSKRVSSTSLLEIYSDTCDVKGCHLGQERVSSTSPQPSGTIKNQADFVEKPEGGWVAELKRNVGG